MDSWKDLELEKMRVRFYKNESMSIPKFYWLHFQVGGNRNANEFFKSQPDWNESLTIEQKYNTKAAALYRDKVNKITYLLVIKYLAISLFVYTDSKFS